MRKNKLIKILFTITMALIASKSGWAGVYPIDMASFNMLPPHCQAWWAGVYKAGNAPGIVINPEKYNEKLWAKRVGAWVTFNHYCPGLVALNKLKFGRYKSPSEKNELMHSAASSLEYQIQQNKVDTQNAWIIAEAYLKLAELNELANKDGDAVKLYNKAIEIHPSYIKAYAGLSDLYKKMGMKSEAKEILEKAIKIKPNSKGLIRRLAKLEK